MNRSEILNTFFKSEFLIRGAITRVAPAFSEYSLGRGKPLRLPKIANCKARGNEENTKDPLGFRSQCSRFSNCLHLTPDTRHLTLEH